MRDEFDVMLGEFLHSPAEDMSLLLFMADWLDDHPERGEGRPLPGVLRAHAAGGWVPEFLEDEKSLLEIGDDHLHCWHNGLDREVRDGPTLHMRLFNRLQEDRITPESLCMRYTVEGRIGKISVRGGWGRQRYRTAADAFTALWMALERQGTEAQATSEISGRQSNDSRQMSS